MKHKHKQTILAQLVCTKHRREGTKMALNMNVTEQKLFHHLFAQVKQLELQRKSDTLLCVSFFAQRVFFLLCDSLQNANACIITNLSIIICVANAYHAHTLFVRALILLSFTVGFEEVKVLITVATDLELCCAHLS